MDDKDYVDELVLYLLRKDAEELEATGSSRNFRSDDVGHANPETDHREIQVNSWLESDTNFSASSFFPETGVASSLPTPFSIQGYGSSFDIPTSASLAGAQQSNSEATEESPANSFLVPVETARGDFFRTDDTLSNPSEHSSTQHNIGWSNWGQVPQNSLGAYDSTRRKRENNPAEFFPRKTLAHSDSAWSTQISMERGRNEAMAQTEENYRELSSTSSIFSPIIDISSMEMAPDRISLGSVAAAEAVSSGGPTGIRTRSDQTGKDKSFKCDVCGKIFGQKRSLDVHNRTHTGEKPFVCSTCGRGFGQQGNLKRHRLTHTGEKSFPCDICGKSFARKVHLDSHLRTHTGEKPFKCEFCDECFPSQGNRIRHQKRKHARMLDTLPLSFNDEK